MQKELEVKVLNIDVDIVVEKLKKLSAKFLKIEHQKKLSYTINKVKYYTEWKLFKNKRAFR